MALYGDDHSCKSSSIPHQSEHVMMGCALPIFYQTSVQEILDFGLRGVARPELLEAIEINSRNAKAAREVKNENDSGQAFFIAPN